MGLRHFRSLLDLSPQELQQLIARAIEMKTELRKGIVHPLCRNKVLGMVFEKSSTRTRVSFETGMVQLGGNAIFLSPRDTQLGRGEPIEDSARVLSSMVDILMLRTFEQNTLETFASYSSVPVINGLTDAFHPCQLLADIQTFVEHRGSIAGHTVAWIGDGNNMCQSYINAAEQFNFQLRIACPDGFTPDQELLQTYRDHVEVSNNPVDAVRDASLVVTDVWASMGQEDQQAERLEKFAGFQVNHELMQHAAQHALVMHCLPAHRGEEISAELMEAEDCVIWQEAENRLHAQKALIEFLILAAD
ncbi:MAG: ornithine carbamoyltransferase [Pseudomonadales bacterium]